MSEVSRAVAVAVLLLLAGCSGATQADPSTVSTTTPQPTATTEHSTTSTTSTERSTTRDTTVATTEAPPSNPWQSDSVVVSVTHWNQSTPPSYYVNAVENATTYWNEKYDDYSRFEEVQFVLRPNATDPDIRVSITDSVTYCGGTANDTFVGCADLYKPGDIADDTSLVEIEAGYTPASTNETVRHEFGHLLGLEHGDEPMPLMAAASETVPISEPNASQRPYPWTKQTLTVAITGSPSEDQREQIDAALTYFEEGADGMLTNTKPQFSYTENEEQADIVIEAASNEWACGEEYSGGSCADYFGYDEDAEPALEYYSRVEITLSGTRDDTTAWHTAYWIAIGLGARGEEIPDPIDNEDDEPTTDWWE